MPNATLLGAANKLSATKFAPLGATPRSNRAILVRLGQLNCLQTISYRFTSIWRVLDIRPFIFSAKSKNLCLAALCNLTTARSLIRFCNSQCSAFYCHKHPWPARAEPLIEVAVKWRKFEGRLQFAQKRANWSFIEDLSPPSISY